VLDTGANVNIIDVELVDELKLPLVMRSKDLDIIGSVGVGGSFQAGEGYFRLGNCTLEGLPPDQNYTFMTNLTALALPHPSPAGDGLLSLTLFSSFPAWVEFDWHGTDGDPPTLIFYFGTELPESARKGLTRVPLERNAVAGILSLTINMNGKDMPAILDTGSPMTVISHQVAKEANIETVAPEKYFSSTTFRQQALGDEVLMVGGVDGGHLNLYRSVSSEIPIRAGNISFGEGPVYVGDLPGLAAMMNASETNQTTSPSVVLGLDFLRRMYRMILRVPASEVWFEELPR
jgi:hypothetical protein